MGEGSEEEGAETWQLMLCRSVDIINSTDTQDPYLTSVCSILQRVVLSEVQRKDLELIANVVLYTLCSKETTSITKKGDGKEGRDGKEGKDMREKDWYESGQRPVSTGKKESEDSESDLKLSPLSLLRVYLLRLLFTMYNEHISKVTMSMSTSSSKDRDRDRNQGVMEKER